MMVAPVGKGKRDLENEISKKADDAEGKKADDETTQKAVNQEGEAPNREAEFEAFEATRIPDEVSITQREQIAGVEDGTIQLEGYEGHRNGNHKRKGNYGEMKMDQHFEGVTEINGEEASLTALHERITSIDETGHKGIDGVYENAHPPPKYIIAESKYGSSDLNPDTKDGPQMSDNWIEGSDRLENAVGREKAREILAEGYERVLTKIDVDGNVTTYKIDVNGEILDPWP